MTRNNLEHAVEHAVVQAVEHAADVLGRCGVACHDRFLPRCSAPPTPPAKLAEVERWCLHISLTHCIELCSELLVGACGWAVG